MGKEHIDVASSLSKLGVFYFYQRNFGRAEPLFLRALKIAEKSFGKMDIRLINFLTNLSELYVAMGDQKKAHAFQSMAVLVQNQNTKKKPKGRTQKVDSESI